MTGCGAFYCKNRSEKGFVMCRFPANLRRKIWEHFWEKGVEDWTASVWANSRKSANV